MFLQLLEKVNLIQSPSVEIRITPKLTFYVLTHKDYHSQTKTNNSSEVSSSMQSDIKSSNTTVVSKANTLNTNNDLDTWIRLQDCSLLKSFAATASLPPPTFTASTASSSSSSNLLIEFPLRLYELARQYANKSKQS